MTLGGSWLSVSLKFGDSNRMREEPSFPWLLTALAYVTQKAGSNLVSWGVSTNSDEMLEMQVEEISALFSPVFPSDKPSPSHSRNIFSSEKQKMSSLYTLKKKKVTWGHTFIDFIEKERGIDVRAKQWWLASHICPTRYRTLNPGVCPDLESNLQHFWYTGQCFKQLSHLARDLYYIFSTSIII